MSHTLDFKIRQLKRLLEVTAKRHQYDLGHPRVLEISRRLDRLIVQMMSGNHR